MSGEVVETWACVKLTGRCCWTWRVAWGVVVALSMAACAKLLVLTELSRSSSLLRKTLFKVPFFPFNAVSFLFNVSRGIVRHQLGRSLSIRSNTPRQQREEPTANILKFLLFMGVSPNFGWGTPNFKWHPNMPFWTLWSFHVLMVNSFLSSVEMFEVFKVSFRILKVLCNEFSLFISHNA